MKNVDMWLDKRTMKILKAVVVCVLGEPRYNMKDNLEYRTIGV